MNKIVEAKTILPLPTLMASFALGELAKQSARCPFHDDRHSSFSVWQGGDGRWSFKCHAGCGAGDEINFLELHENLSRRDAVKRFLDVAGLNGATPPRFEAGRTLRESSARNRGENRMEMNACHMSHIPREIMRRDNPCRTASHVLSHATNNATNAVLGRPPYPYGMPVAPRTVQPRRALVAWLVASRT